MCVSALSCKFVFDTLCKYLFRSEETQDSVQNQTIGTPIMTWLFSSAVKRASSVIRRQDNAKSVLLALGNVSATLSDDTSTKRTQQCVLVSQETPKDKKSFSELEDILAKDCRSIITEIDDEVSTFAFVVMIP